MTLSHLLRSDLRRIETRGGLARCLYQYFAHPGFRAAALYRIASALRRARVPALPVLITSRAHSTTGAHILPGAKIGPGLLLPHPSGVVIGEGVVMGAHCTLLQGATLGERYSGGDRSYPILSDGVTMCAGSIAIGGIHIGAGATVGANAVVISDVASGDTVVGAPARSSIRSGKRPEETLQSLEATR